MCFSATASFGLAAALVPVSAYTLHAARMAGRRWLGFGLFPAAFALQQAIEGVLWLGLNAGDQGTIAAAARGFLFFSHFFWPAWAPFSVWLVEPCGQRRRLAGALAVLGALYGLSLMFPPVLLPDRLAVVVIGGSIEYRTGMIYDGLVGPDLLRLVYAAIVLVPLLSSSWRALQLFGVLIAASMALALGLHAPVFVSVWCFYAAALSAWMAGMFALRGRFLHAAA